MSNESSTISSIDSESLSTAILPLMAQLNIDHNNLKKNSFLCSGIFEELYKQFKLEVNSLKKIIDEQKEINKNLFNEVVKTRQLLEEFQKNNKEMKSNQSIFNKNIEKNSSFIISKNFDDVPMIRNKNDNINIEDLKNLIAGKISSNTLFDKTKLENGIKIQNFNQTHVYSPIITFESAKCNLLSNLFINESVDFVITSFTGSGFETLNHRCGVFFILTKNNILNIRIRFSNNLERSLCSIKTLASLFGELDKMLKQKIINYNSRLVYLIYDSFVGEFLAKRRENIGYLNSLMSNALKTEALNFLKNEVSFKNVKYIVQNSSFLEKILCDEINKTSLCQPIGKTVKKNDTYGEYEQFFN
uniref:Uncharacterized protein n=1 Tax=Strongyloides stercoralis TaxID=6248 RepID=A0AAF5I380_STRER